MNSFKTHHYETSASLPVVILQALPLIMRVLSAQMRETKHTIHSGHLPVLAALDIRPRTQSELAEMMSVSGATMSNTLTTLEERGWISRERSRDDRRVVTIALTSTGKAALDETMIEMEGHVEDLIKGLDENERRDLMRGMLILRDVFYSAIQEGGL